MTVRGRVLLPCSNQWSRKAVDPAQLTVIETEYGVETGAAAFQTLMGLPNPPTVIFCGNDVLAVGAFCVARIGWGSVSRMMCP